VLRFDPKYAIGDLNEDGAPGVAGEDDDGDGLVDEDSRGRQPNEDGYLGDLTNDDDEDGLIDEDPGKWDHIIIIKDYRWIDYSIPENEIYRQTLGHAYNFIHACPSPTPGQTREVFYDPEDYDPRYPIVRTPFNQTGRIYRTEFRRPNR